MIQNTLRHLSGIQGYGVLSLLLFFGFFTAIVAWALRQKRSHLERMAHLPLEPETEESVSANSHEQPRE
jgi:cbb3-type cytochrome oxidase subunit 3